MRWRKEGERENLSPSLLCVAAGLAKKFISNSALMTGRTCPFATTNGRSLVVIHRSVDR